MAIRDQRREEAIERMADHLLAHGTAGASLRTLAAAAGTSDRMLLYYFADKDELIAETYARIGSRFTALLEAGFADGARRAPETLLAELWAAMGSPAVAPFMRFWLDVASAAARGAATERAVAGGIARGFADWIEARLDLPEPAARAAAAARLLATIDGMMLLDAVGLPDLAARAASHA